MRMANIAKKVLFAFFLLVSSWTVVLAAPKSLKRNPKPCNRLLLHFHGIEQVGNSTVPNATVATVIGSLPGFGKFGLGEMHVFDTPVTRDVDMKSPPAAQARGFYLYDRKDTYNTLFLITLTFNSSEYEGSLTMLGNNEHLQKTRDLAVVGGTGDFFMARGITTLETEVIDIVKPYFRLRMDVKLYECY